jgi:hypothetical protein
LRKNLKESRFVVQYTTLTGVYISTSPTLSPGLQFRSIYALGGAAFLGAAFFGAGFFAVGPFYQIRNNETRNTLAAGFFATLAPAVFGFVAFFAAAGYKIKNHFLEVGVL